MAEQEHAFALETQGEILASQAQESGTKTRHDRSDGASAEDEESPLLRRRSPVTGAGAGAGASKDTSRTHFTTFAEPWTSHQGLPWYKTPSIFWLLPAFFPICLAFGGLLVPKTYLILNLICRDYLADRSAADPSYRTHPVILGEQNDECRDAHVQSLVARFQLYSSLLSGIFSALVAPYLGALSDRVGRKKIIALSTAGLFLEEIITICVGTYPDTLSVYWLLVGFVVDGLCGSFMSAMAISFAYATDCTPPERRNVAIGYFHGTLFAGIAIGPILSGFLMKWTGTILSAFYLALACHVFFIVFLLVLIPESVSKDRQLHARDKYQILTQETQDVSWWTSLQTYNLFEPLAILWPKGPGTTPALRRNLVLLASIDTIMFGVSMGAMGIILIYPQYVFGWDPIQASEFLSIANICRVAGLLVVLPLVTRYFRPAGPAGSRSGHRGADMLDIRIVRVAILLDLIGFAGYATAVSGGMMVAAAMVAAFAGVGSPTLSSAITAHVSPDRTGQVLGAIGLLHGLARVVAPTVFNTIYSFTVGKFTPAVFVCLGSLFMVVFVLSWFLRPGVSYEEPDIVDTPSNREDVLDGSSE